MLGGLREKGKERTTEKISGCINGGHTKGWCDRRGC